MKTKEEKIEVMKRDLEVQQHRFDQLEE